jgi:Fic family protein
MTQNKSTLGRPSSDALFAQFAKVAETIKNYGGLPTLNQAADIWDDIWYVEAHNSTAIEGNTLVLSEVKALLQQKRSLGGKRVKEYMEVQGYANAAKWVYAQGKNPKMKQVRGDIISLTEVRFIHTELMKLVWEIAPHPDAYGNEHPGSFRRHDIRPFGDGMTPPAFTNIPAQLNSWLNQVNSGVKGLEPKDIPLFLAKTHRDFESIHPFLDGNGRIGRLLISLFLLDKKILSTPALYTSYYLKKNRVEYYDRLGEVRRKGNYEQWVQFFLEAISESAADAVSKVYELNTLHEKNRELIGKIGRASENAMKIFDYLEANPIIEMKGTSEALGLSYNTTSNIVKKLIELGIVVQNKKVARNRTFAYEDYLVILREGTLY